MGYIVIPGSRNKDHILDNINVFDFELTNEEMERIHKLDGKGRFFNMSEEDQERWFLGSTIDFDAQK